MVRLPTIEETPGMPQKGPLESLQHAVRRLLGKFSGLGNVDPFLAEGYKNNCYRCTLTIQLPKHPDIPDIVAVGEDPLTKVAAQHAAALHALGQLHQAGLLETAWAMQATKIPKEIGKQTGPTGMLDIFNYAARYNCIPRYDVNALKLFNVLKIEMPEHDIKVIIDCKGGDTSKSERWIAAEFKKQAEAYHLRNGTDSFVVNDSTALNVDNASQFATFYDGLRRSRIFVDTEELRGKFSAQARIGPKPLGPPVIIGKGGKRDAEKVARLVGAVAIVQQEPQLLEDFQTALRNRSIRERSSPLDLIIDRSTSQRIDEVNHFLQQQSRHYRTEETQTSSSDAYQSTRYVQSRKVLTGPELEAKSIELQQRLALYNNRPDLEQLRKIRFQLPMNQYAQQVRDIVDNNIFCVIVGATGSGKTTQVPQILLDQAIQNGSGATCNVICTQPRRIAATSVARRVADERAQHLQDTVGYHVRFDAKLPKASGSMIFCTTGILLQQLQHGPDEVYDKVSHLIIDEVHEREMQIDYLLIIIKKTMAHRISQGKKVPRVILMSATIDAERFSDYFKDCLPWNKPTACPTLFVPGRTFPVKERYLHDLVDEVEREHGRPVLTLLPPTDKDSRDYLAAEMEAAKGSQSKVEDNLTSVIDWKSSIGRDGQQARTPIDSVVPLGLVSTTVAHIAKTTPGGAILVFLPGLDEILKVDKLLREARTLNIDFNNQAKFRIFMLHSSIADQKTVFESLPPDCRKIILSTNIAETSVTIPDVQFVVDTGKCREKQYDQIRRVSQLQCTWISKSNVKQRAGRAGRVQNGNYYALYTSSRYESMRALGLPELLRSELQEVCLDIKAQAFKMPVRDFLAEAIEPPSPHAVDLALENLTSLGALTETEDITPLGRVLALLPVHPTLGKMILLGIIFRCLGPMIILGAAATERALFVNPVSDQHAVRRVKQKFAEASFSDHIMLLKAFNMVREADSLGSQSFQNIADAYYIHRGAFSSIKNTAAQIEQILKEAGLISQPRFAAVSLYGGEQLNENSHSEELVKALLLAGLYPNLAMQKQTGGGHFFFTPSERVMSVHPSSVNFNQMKLRANRTPRLLSFTASSLDSNGGKVVYLRDTTVVTPLMALLFGSGQLRRDGRVLELDEWLQFFVKAEGSSDIGPRHSGDHTHQLWKLRHNLDNLLAGAFRDLAVKKSLHENAGRKKMADAMVGILTSHKQALENPVTGGQVAEAKEPFLRAQAERPPARSQAKASFLRAQAERPPARSQAKPLFLRAQVEKPPARSKTRAPFFHQLDFEPRQTPHRDPSRWQTPPTRSASSMFRTATPENNLNSSFMRKGLSSQRPRRDVDQQRQR